MIIRSRLQNNPKQCECCKKSFIPKVGSRGRFCSRTCGMSAGKKKRYSRSWMFCDVIYLNCHDCGSLFTRPARIFRKSKSREIFCSKQCSMRHSGHRKKFGSKNPNWGRGENVVGELNGNWRGGRTKNARLFRKSTLYVKWRNEVFTRDGYRCVKCGSLKSIEADHIKPVKTHFELALVVKNGRTLCKPCHIKTPTYGGRQTEVV